MREEGEERKGREIERGGERREEGGKRGGDRAGMRISCFCQYGCSTKLIFTQRNFVAFSRNFLGSIFRPYSQHCR